MSARPQIVDQFGKPMISARGATAHEAAGYGRELAGWNPGQFSADSEWISNGEMEASRDRLDDLIRNNGIASGAVQTSIDNIVGTGLLLNCRPDRLALGLKDETRAEELDAFEDEVEAKFDNWAEDICCYVDASRRSRLSGLIAQGYRSYMSAFEILASAEWLPRPNSKFATAIQMIDPRRLSNPMGQSDGARLRAGVELGSMGEPTAYWIASHIQGDPAGWSGQMRSWKRVPRELSIGRQQILHVFDNDKPGRSRGKVGMLSALLDHKMHEKWSRVSLEAAAYNASYVAYIESALDWTAVRDAMGAGDAESTTSNDATMRYLANTSQFHRDQTLYMNGLKIPHLYPGEKFSHTAPNHPVPSFEMFERAALRRLSAAWGLTYAQLSKDYSQSNYSSERAALLDVWRFFSGKQYHIAGWFATLVYALWFEEAVDNGEVKLPSGLPDFYEAKTAWTGCDWIGPGRGLIDILKEAEGDEKLYGMNLETLEALAAKQGRRWRKLLQQRAQESRFMKKIGIAEPKIGTPTPGRTSDPTPPASADPQPVDNNPPRPAPGGGAAAALQ
jgi:lambda family phage portal protein